MSNIIDIPGQNNEITKTGEAKARIMETKAYLKAQNKKNKGSATYQSTQRTFNAMKEFMKETNVRNKKSGWKDRLFTDDEALKKECSEFLTFCLEKELMPTWALLSVWLNCDVSTLTAARSLDDSRSLTFKKVETILFTLLEQMMIQREGNPAALIFLSKAQWGLSDAQNINVNINNMTQASNFQPTEVENCIDLTPDDWTNR